MAESDILFTKGFLKQERVGLETGVGDMTTELGIGATIVSAWEDITVDVDNEILDRVLLINDQKRIIAAAMTAMYNSSTCGIASGTATFSTSGLTDILSYGDNFSVIKKIYSSVFSFFISLDSVSPSIIAFSTIPAFSRILFSISFAISGLSLKKFLTFSLP